ncbi:uncharacterized protein [Dendrobates tinctorius]|uniref:uncharacterized protein n=1 Tax=Dendrobates tinctorius TaxID=92724 RepID=UPI003CC96513
MDGWDNASPRVRKDFLNKVRTRWRSMKDRFNRDIRQENKVRSGAAARTGTKYRYHRALAFLRPVLASRTTWSSTLQPGPEAVLHQAAPDPSQPSISEEAPCRSAPQSSGDQEAGRSGVPLSQVSATGFAGTSRQQRQRTLDRPLMPEFVELSSVFQSSLKALSDRLESGFLLLDQCYKSIEGRLERLEVDLARPVHHFYTQIARDTAEHLTPDLQLTVMHACNNAFMQAMQQSRIMQQSAVAFPPVPPLTRFTALPTSAAYYCTATTLPSLAGHQYTAPSPSAAGHLPANTMPSAAPAWPTTAAATTTGWPVVNSPACSAATTTTSGRTTPEWTATATTPAWTATTTSTTTSEQHQLGDLHSIFTAPMILTFDNEKQSKMEKSKNLTSSQIFLDNFKKIVNWIGKSLEDEVVSHNYAYTQMMTLNSLNLSICNVVDCGSDICDQKKYSSPADNIHMRQRETEQDSKKQELDLNETKAVDVASDSLY